MQFIKGNVIPLQARCGPEGGRGIALLFHERGTRRVWVVSSTHRPHFTSGKDLVPILQEAGWVPGPVLMGGNSHLHRDSIPDRPARSQSLYRLRYAARTASTGCLFCPPNIYTYIKVKQSRYRPEVPRGFQEVKVPKFRDNGTGWW